MCGQPMGGGGAHAYTPCTPMLDLPMGRKGGQMGANEPIVALT